MLPFYWCACMYFYRMQKKKKKRLVGDCYKTLIRLQRKLNRSGKMSQITWAYCCSHYQVQAYYRGIFYTIEVKGLWSWGFSTQLWIERLEFLECTQHIGCYHTSVVSVKLQLLKANTDLTGLYTASTGLKHTHTHTHTNQKQKNRRCVRQPCCHKIIKAVRTLSYKILS